MEEESTQGINEGMIEAAEQWAQLLIRFEKEQLSDGEKERLIREYFDIPEEETIPDFFQIPTAQKPEKEPQGKTRKRTRAQKNQ